MSDVVIQVEGLSKQYRLGEVSTGSLHHDINRWWHRVRGKEDPYLALTGENIRTGKREGNAGRSSASTTKTKLLCPSVSSVVPNSDFSSDYVWALRDINFEVKRGEVLGIIGRNGAGKSTLLKILSRITAPTSGEVRIKGRIGSLLEVGTGFHQDLTGRENIYLNGAVLGMSKSEISAKLDEIVDFSGCAAYLDTPVKRYSSGMVVRLAFAVAAHLEPEILIVDEVLAVGDLEFQKKCIGKMSEVARHGRTVLFVSHNLAAVQNLCQTALWLDNGTVAQSKDTSEKVVSTYEQSGNVKQGTMVFSPNQHRIKSPLQVISISMLHEGGESAATFKYGEPVRLRLHIESTQHYSGIQIGIALRSNGVVLSTIHSPSIEVVVGQVLAVDCEISGGILRPGIFGISVGASIPSTHIDLDTIQDAGSLVVSDIGVTRDWVYDFKRRGIVQLDADWKHTIKTA